MQNISSISVSMRSASVIFFGLIFGGIDVESALFAVRELAFFAALHMAAVNALA